MPLADSPDEPTFYMTDFCDRESLRPLVADGDIPVMLNVMRFERSHGLKVRPVQPGRYIIDSGGYTAMDEFGGDFPWTVGEYDEWAADMYAQQPFEWIAAMDLACEPAFDDDMTVDARIDATVENLIELLGHDPDYPVLPVLQGREVADWIRCYDLFRDHGIDPEYAGIGTLCRQTSGQDIADIVRAIRARTDIERFHGFGVKATAYNYGARFWTADSQAWAWPLMFGKYYTPTGSGMVKADYDDHTDAVVRESFRTYYDHCRDLQQSVHARATDSTPTTLGEYC